MPIFPVASVVTILTPPCPLVGAVDRLASAEYHYVTLALLYCAALPTIGPDSWQSAIPLP